MALDFFRVYRGVELDETIQILTGSGAPGIAGDTSLAPVGSTYQDSADGSMWTKIAAGVGTVRWRKMASEEYVNNAVGATVSWREPVEVRATVTALPVGTPGNPITIDGQSIVDGGRVLFANHTGPGGKNVFIYDQAAGAWVEDINAESPGDSVFIIAGTDAGKTYIFNGTDWVLSSQSSEDELGFIRSFIGKGAGGSEATDYSSNNIVVDGTSLETAIGALDTKLGGNVATGNYVVAGDTTHANITALDTAIGNEAILAGQDWVSSANSVNQNLLALDNQLGAPIAAGNFIALDDQLSVAITSLDQQLGTQVANGNFILAAVKTNQNIQALDVAIGAAVTTVPGVILNTNSVNANIQSIAATVSTNNLQTTVTNVTSPATIDAVAAGAAKWLVRVEVDGDPTRVYSAEVFALSNGATVDFTRYAVLKIGTAIAGLSVSADYDSGDIRLRVTSTTAVNVIARRVSVVI